MFNALLLRKHLLILLHFFPSRNTLKSCILKAWQSKLILQFRSSPSTYQFILEMYACAFCQCLTL